MINSGLGRLDLCVGGETNLLKEEQNLDHILADDVIECFRLSCDIKHLVRYRGADERAGYSRSELFRNLDTGERPLEHDVDNDDIEGAVEVEIVGAPDGCEADRAIAVELEEVTHRLEDVSLIIQDEDVCHAGLRTWYGHEESNLGI